MFMRWANNVLLFYACRLEQSLIKSSILSRSDDCWTGLSNDLLHMNCTYQDQRPCHCRFDWDSVVFATFDTVDRAFDAAASAFGIDPFDVRAIAAASFASMLR